MNFIKVLEGTTSHGKKRKKVVIDFSDLTVIEELSVEEQIEEMKVQDDMELLFKTILDGMGFQLDIDNSGIGEYQIGSSNEFDHGEDYISIDGVDTKIQVVIILGQVSSLAARNLLRDSCLVAERTLYHKDLTLAVKLAPVLSYEGRGFISYKVGIKDA